MAVIAVALLICAALVDKLIVGSPDTSLSTTISEIATTLVVGALALWFVRFTYTRAVRLSQQLSLSRSPIAGIADGLVLIEGKAVSIETITAPASSKRVIGYHLTATPLARLLDDDYCDREVSDLRDFRVDDGTGIAVVEAARAHLFLTREPPTGRRLLQSERRPELNAEWNTCVESLLEEGETVVVRGVARVTGEGAARSVVISAPPGGHLLIADRSQRALLEAITSSDIVERYVEPAPGPLDAQAPDIRP